MKGGLFKSLRERVGRLFSRSAIDDSLFDELEEALIEGDVPIRIVSDLIDDLRTKIRSDRIQEPEAARSALIQLIADRLRNAQSPLTVATEPPSVYLFLGVNGSGKTTTIAKLAHRFISNGKRVLVAAADTFRAAAIEQLDTWAGRVGADIVRSQPGADPASVVFDAITAAKARHMDFVLADTAGRQHTKVNLMQELSKVVAVAGKALGRPPDEVLLVLDGNTGQNAIRQAEEFSKVAGVTGVVITKLDGTPKGGAALGIKDTLGLPIKLIGVGEKPEDLIDFDSESFARELIG